MIYQYTPLSQARLHQQRIRDLLKLAHVLDVFAHDRMTPSKPAPVMPAGARRRSVRWCRPADSRPIPR